MRKCTVHVNVWFDDMMAENTEDAHEAIKQALVSMHEHCVGELSAALESIGARDVHLETVVF
jgi:hypothetical protein